MVGAFDPETLTVLRGVFDDACKFLPQHHDTAETRSRLAESILTIAADGERDPERIRTHALQRLIPWPVETAQSL